MSLKAKENRRKSVWWRFRRITSSGEYIRELDGLRFLAIAVVLTAHTWGNWLNHTAMDYRLESPSTLDVFYKRVTMNGKLGVQLFFMISGFILSLPWAKHFCAQGKPVNLKGYYLRRLTRLEPPYLICMVGYFVLLCLMGRLSVDEHWGNLLASLLYGHNITYGTGSIVYQAAWSLEIEVQFYLLAPFIAIILFRCPAVYRRLLLCGLILLFASMQAIIPNLPPSILYQGHFFMAGFLLSDFFVSRGEIWKRRSYAYDVIALGGYGIAFFAVPPHSETITGQIGYLVGLTIVFFCGFKGRIFSGFLRIPLICAIGGMCYTIYLLHGRIITFIYAYLLKNVQLTGDYSVDHTILNVLLIPVVIGLSAIFFVLIERPCMDRAWPRKVWNRLCGRTSASVGEPES